MIQLQTNKVAMGIQPAVVNNATATAVAIDTNGYDYAAIYFHLGATDIALTALKIQECATSGGTYTDVPSGAQLVMPNATDDNHVWAWELDLRNRLRYLKVIATVGNGAAGAYVSSICLLGNGEKTPVSAADKGVQALVTI